MNLARPLGVSEDHWVSCFTNRRLELIILPTEQCNFRCSYCYEDFALGKMKPETVSSIKQFVLRRAGELDFLHISWFGGEPLLAKDIILDLGSFAYDLAQEYKFNFVGGLTTNAYLLDKVTFEEFNAIGHRRFQISLDGWQDGHDATRRQRNGRGTFDRIWSNILEIGSSDKEAEITFRIHLSANNFETLDELCTNIATHFGHDERIHILFHDLRNLGGPGGASVQAADPRKLQSDVRNLIDTIQKIAPNLSSRISSAVGAESESSSTPLTTENGGEPYICYASKPNSLLIRSNGNIGKCTVQLSNQKNDIGRILDGGKIEIDQKKLRYWLRGLTNYNHRELACPALDYDFLQEDSYLKL